MKKIKLKKDIDPMMRPIENWTYDKSGFRKPDDGLIILENESQLGDIKFNGPKGDIKINDDNRWDGPLGPLAGSAALLRG